jgi:membrane-bound metal-dependent hydrolase YbcI (DUF457 family)
MLPPGHFAAGYLSTKALLKYLPYSFTAAQINQLLFFGAFIGLAVDFDLVYAFLKLKSLRATDPKASHRKFISHAPIIWLAIGLAIYFVAKNPFYKSAGLIIWLASWSHFLLDSLEWGVIWLWPFSKKRFAIFKTPDAAELDKSLGQQGFFKYLFNYLKFYSTRISFYLEVLIIIIAILTYATTASYR